jgi:hypothetical protein
MRRRKFLKSIGATTATIAGASSVPASSFFQIPMIANNSVNVNKNGGVAVLAGSTIFDGASGFLSRVPSAAGNRRTWVWETIVKRSKSSDVRNLLFEAVDGAELVDIRFHDSPTADILQFQYWNGSSNAALFYTDALFRDYSAYYHIIIAVDTTQSTESDRFRLWINGGQVTSFSTASYPAQNLEMSVNAAAPHYVGAEAGGTPRFFFSGYMARMSLLDGATIVDPETDGFGSFTPEGYWQIGDISDLSFGANGFLLEGTNLAIGESSEKKGNGYTVGNVSGGTASGSSGTAPANAFDDDADSKWWTLGEGQAGSGYLQYDFGSGVSRNIRRISIKHAGGYMWRTFKLQYSDDGSAWSDLQEDGGSTTLTSTGSGIGNTVTYDSYRFLDGGSHRYWRLQGITGADAPGEPTVYELKLHEVGDGENHFFNHGSLTSTAESPEDGHVVFNCLAKTAGGTQSFSNGNRTIYGASGNNTLYLGNHAIPKSSKWYFEVKIDNISDGTTNTTVGLLSSQNLNIFTNSNPFLQSFSYGCHIDDQGKIYSDGSLVKTAATFSSGDVIGLAIDSTSGGVWMSINGQWVDTDGSDGSAIVKSEIESGVTSSAIRVLTQDQMRYDWFPATGLYTNGVATIYSQENDFEYTLPNGFTAVSQQNFPDALITNSSSHFDTMLRSGNDGSYSVTSLGFNPSVDGALVWSKDRTAGNSHHLHDSVRGVNLALRCDDTTAEEAGELDSFDSAGYTVTSNGGVYKINRAGSEYVDWIWRAGGPAVPNNDGSISSQVSVNQAAGFSIVSYSGTSAVGTVGHGLSKAPEFVMIKRLDVSVNWGGWHIGLTDGTQAIRINTANAEATQTGHWNSTVPDESVIYLGPDSEVNTSTKPHICYCWHSVEGYSKIGAFEGNGSTDGSFVYLGFRPAWVLIKNADVANSWHIFDSKRNPYNPTISRLIPDDSSTEADVEGLDFLSNGFKLRTTADSINGSGNTMIYMAFAEVPLKYARAR